MLGSSWRGGCVLLIGHARVHCDPVWFPGFAAVVREGLFEAVGGCGDVFENIAHQDSATVEWFLIVKFAAVIFEFADGGDADGALRAVRKIQAPLVRLRIVEAQREAFDVAGGAVHFQFHQVGAAIPEFADDGGAFVFDPGGGTG